MIPWLDISKQIPGVRGQVIHAVKSGTELLVSTLSHLDFRTYVIDGSKIVDEESFFHEVARILEFPEYFGHGWASWDDCLGDFGSLASYRIAIVWEHADQTFAADAQTFLRAVCDLHGLAIHLALYPTRYPEEGMEAKQLELFFLGRGEGFSALHVG